MSAPKTILVVDDNPSNLHLLFDLLSETGFQVAIAESGDMALETLELIVPDLILLDINMPGLDGFATCQQLKRRPEFRDVPVIFMSALAESVNKIQGFSVGAVDYITKPFDTQETLARVKNHLALREAQAERDQLNRELERRVQERTAELEALNQQLLAEVEERKRTEIALRESESQFRLMFEQAPIGMVVTDGSGQWVEGNFALAQLLNYSGGALCGHHWRHLVREADWPVLERHYEAAVKGEKNYFHQEVACQTRAGKHIHGVLHAVVLRGGAHSPTYLLCQFMDLTQRKTVEAELRHNACHDALTQLPNRAMLTQQLDITLAKARQNPFHKFAVLFLDLNRFKLVNDSLGHQVGDQLLVAIARRLETVIRDSDMIARLGGDEFVVLLNGIGSQNVAIHVADRIESVLKVPFELGEHSLFITASIGIALGHTGYEKGADLLRDADIAMYSAKSNKAKEKKTYELFEPGMFTRVSGQLQLESELHQALERDEFQLYYQPIVSLSTGRIQGFEALLRWFNPHRGIVSPVEFIPIAEETGLIIPMGEWVLKTAYEQLIQWREQFEIAQNLKMSVNISTPQLKDPNFLLRLDDILMQAGWNGKGLQLELTESICMDNSDAIVEVLQQLKTRGIELCIDDFGTGYSSLSYLHRFPIDHLKIDRAFVKRIQVAGEQREIAQTVITLAHHLGMDTIAEGVELPHQLAQLRAMECEAAQGYFFAKPLNREAAEALLAEHTHYPLGTWDKAQF